MHTDNGTSGTGVIPDGFCKDHCVNSICSNPTASTNCGADVHAVATLYNIGISSKQTYHH